ncbi:hypothetical protein P691DRAFT_768811 [Macrolepiota fuliginosa MF-IS2]|uniref:Uncharacterized protein n=1 Tax=Macrolepiota fuliginosa MF-IS2 TaxID=1400762 RepID=A0A9P5WYU4_9AGAR|nr:hypothetical protein P691DRAFT_768811 [Macrolepiota fuliginosa MF-IS2]
MQHFLAMMNQNHHVASQFSTEELEQLYPEEGICFQIFVDLMKMGFILLQPKPNSSTPIEVDNNDEDASKFDELSPAGELTNTIAAFGQWFKDNNILDNECPSLIDNIRHLAMMFSLIPDIPMEPITPTCAFSRAASQTPAPSHEDSTPPPPPAVVATSPAAAASILPASPHGRTSYAGTVAKNLNPAAPPFMHGPPHAPVAPPAQAPKASSKRPFYVTQGPSC